MPKMPNLGRLPKLMKDMSEREARKKAAKQKEKIKIQDEKDMAGVQGAKEGGRIGLRGGGICKRGMNRDAVGKNS
jgi:hypothetical protein